MRGRRALRVRWGPGEASRTKQWRPPTCRPARKAKTRASASWRLATQRCARAGRLAGSGANVGAGLGNDRAHCPAAPSSPALPSSGLSSLRTLWPRNDAWILVAALWRSGSVRSMSSSSSSAPWKKEEQNVREIYVTCKRTWDTEILYIYSWYVIFCPTWQPTSLKCIKKLHTLRW